MKATLKRLVLGFILGALVAFPLGMNYGRGAPWLTNPFKKQDIASKVKAKAEGLVDKTREVIHDATRKGKGE